MIMKLSSLKSVSMALLLSHVKKCYVQLRVSSYQLINEVAFEQSSPLLFEASYYSFCISEQYLTTLSKNDIFKLANLIGCSALVDAQ